MLSVPEITQPPSPWDQSPRALHLFYLYLTQKLGFFFLNRLVTNLILNTLAKIKYFIYLFAMSSMRLAAT